MSYDSLRDLCCFIFEETIVIYKIVINIYEMLRKFYSHRNGINRGRNLTKTLNCIVAKLSPKMTKRT